LGVLSFLDKHEGGDSLNWKIMMVSHWKVVLLLLQIGVLTIALATGTALADPIDNPFGPK